MSVKLYFSVNIGGVLSPKPGQMDDEYDYENITWNTDQVNINKSKKYIVLAHVDWDGQKLISIEKEMEMSFFLSKTELEKIKKENSNYFKNLKRKKRDSSIEKPHDLFIPDTKWEMALSALEMGKYPLFIGPKGCGKTAAAMYLAKMTGRLFFPINCGALVKPKQALVGTIQAKDGSTFIQKSEFLKFFTSDEDVLIYLDELSRLPMTAVNYLMTILDRIQSYIYVEEQGERIYKGKKVVFAAAANFGREYTDTRNLDGAFMDRFIKITLDYLEEEEEIKLLGQRAPAVHDTDLKSLVKNANNCRQNSNLQVAVSTRQLIDMAHFLEKGFTLQEVFDELFVNLFYNGGMDERDTVKMLINGTM